MIPAPANPPAYAFPVRALRRWATEQLVLRAEPEGGVQAEFRLNSERLLLLHPTLGAWQAPLGATQAARLRALADAW